MKIWLNKIQNHIFNLQFILDCFHSTTQNYKARVHICKSAKIKLKVYLHRYNVSLNTI